MENPVLYPSRSAGVNHTSSGTGEDLIGSLLHDRAPLFASILFILIVAVGTTVLSANKTNVPLVGAELGNAVQRAKAYTSKTHQLYQKGYEGLKNRVFRITTPEGEKFIVPHNVIEELQQLPDSHVSNQEALKRLLMNKYIGFFGPPNLTAAVIHTVRSDLTRALGRMNDALTEETAATVAESLGPCDDWTPIKIHQNLLDIVATVSGRIFLGPELCRRPEYKHAAIMYTVDIMAKAVPKLREWPWWTRPVVQFFIPELKTLVEHRRKAHEFLRPVIAERKRMLAAGEEVSDDVLSWVLKKNDEKWKLSDAELAMVQLGLSLAAVHTTTMTTTHILYDLVAHPEVIADLREEIRSVMAENDGVMTMHAQYEMKLLDSVMKESQRINNSFVGMPRLALKPFDLSDGSHIPQGSILEAPARSFTSDPSYFPDPETFNPRRFMDLRSGTTEDPLGYKNKDKYMFSSTSSHLLGFGYGKHACPGRYFASNEIKLILARILLEYDIRMPDGVEGRYENLQSGATFAPDPRKEIMFRRAEKA